MSWMEVSAILLCHPVLVPSCLSLSPGACPCPRVPLLAPSAFSPVLEELLEGGSGAGAARRAKSFGEKPLKSHLQHPSRLTARLGVPAACPLSSPQPVPPRPLSVLSPSPLSAPRSAGGSGQGADKLLQLLYHRAATRSSAWPASFWGVPPASRVLQGAENPAGGHGAARVPPCPTLASPRGFFLRAQHRFPSPHRPAQHHLAWAHPHGCPHRPQSPLSRRWVLLSPLERAPRVARWVPGLLLAPRRPRRQLIKFFPAVAADVGQRFEVSLLIFLISSSKQMSFLPAR